MIGIYCRISKHKEQGRDVSIDVQKKHGIAFAKSQGMEYMLFIDEGISGAEDNIAKRREFVLLLNAIKNEEISIVYCYDQSRIERNNRIWNMFLSLMLEKKCHYYPSGKLFDLDLPENQFFTGVMSLANELYAATTGIKVKDAIYENAKKGKTHGLTAYGYAKDERGFFVINKDEEELVIRIFKMSLDGIGTYTIAKILNKEGIPPKFRRFNGLIKRIDKYTKQVTTYSKDNVIWRGNVIYDMIRNPIYKGVRFWNDESFPVPAIFSEDYWQEVNENLENNKKKVGKREEYHYLLNGLIFCADCNSEFRGKKRLKGRDKAYKCKGKKKHNITCNSRGISIAKLETFIIQHLFISKDLQQFLVGLSENKSETDNLKHKLNREKKELERLERVKKTAYKHLLDPDFEDDEIIKEELKSTKKKIKDKEELVKLLVNNLINREEKSRKKRIDNTIGAYKLNSGFDDTKKLVHSLIKKITISYTVDNVGKKYFYIFIEYNGFDETNTFITDLQALKWIGLVHNRSQAITEKDLKDDRATLSALLKSKGHYEEIPSDFKGFESVESTDCIIELNKDELIEFD